ncbi:MAG: helical backbone metal receptor [Lentimicrobiaceae bacterium]|nr:helical backbone metal receptor [Lentimicrobiaceae bacterium]
MLCKATICLRALVYFYFISLCGSCLHLPDAAGSFLCLTDSYDREIKLDQAPEKIISLSPGITEMMFLLHGEDKLIGISDYCNFPEGTQYIEKVGGLQNINIEKIVSLRPDVVLIGSIIPKNEVEKLEKSGVTVIAIKEEEKLEGMLEALAVLGKIVDNSVLADSLVRVYSEKLEGYNLTAKGAKEAQGAQRSVYYVVSFGAAGDFTAPGNTHISEIIRLAGGRNIGDSLSAWNISREYLFAQNPDFIFVRTEDWAHFVKTYPYTLLRAVKENRVYPIESGWVDVVSPRNFLAVEEIKGKITP